MSTITLPISCFGAFRQFGDHLSVSVPPGCSVQHIKDALVALLGQEHETLIQESVLANDTDILDDTTVFNESAKLSILPPVCGG